MIYLDVCCNDPDNGCFAYKAEQLQIGDAEFEPIAWKYAPKFVETENGIRLSGKNWNVEQSRAYVGNWCWNRYLLQERGKTARWTMVGFLTWLRARRTFSISTGPSDLFEWFRFERELRPVDVHALVCDMG